MREAREMQSECAEDILAVETRLAAIYTEARVDLLNDMLDEYFEEDGTDWSQAPLPTGLRDCCFEIINTLVRNARRTDLECFLTHRCKNFRIRKILIFVLDIKLEHISLESRFMFKPLKLISHLLHQSVRMQQASG